MPTEYALLAAAGGGVLTVLGSLWVGWYVRGRVAAPRERELVARNGRLSERVRRLKDDARRAAEAGEATVDAARRAARAAGAADAADAARLLLGGDEDGRAEDSGGQAED